jgi:hypothetical protein
MNSMQRLLIILLLLINVNSFAQGTAGIYKIRFFIDKRMTNRLVVNNNGMDRLEIPPVLYDSVVNEIVQIVREEMRVDTRLIYSLNNQGEEMRTRSSSDYVGGLPRGTKKRAMRTEYMEYYVKFKIYAGLTKTVGISSEIASYSRLKPYVRVKMKVYGLDKRCKFRKRTRLGGFKSLGSFEFNMGGTTLTNTTALPIEEVMDMVFKGLEKFRNKVK